MRYASFTLRGLRQQNKKEVNYGFDRWLFLRSSPLPSQCAT
jgi:hypothetical protein